MKFHILWSLTILCLASSNEVDVCPWKRLADPCHPLAHPDGSDITCGVEVKNCTGVPFQCRYIGPCPSDQCGPDTEGSRQGRAATAYTSNHWTGGVVPYAIRSVFSEAQKERILDGMRHWEDHTCLRFKERTTERDYIEFYDGSCCCSYIGRRGGKQLVSLARGCFSLRVVAHEIGHAIGYWHEQSRPDRDEHVKVYFSNINQTLVDNFYKRLETNVDSFGTPYDAISVMQYKSYSFSINGMKTIESKYGIPLGGDELSPIDILQTRRMYQCPSDPKNDPPKMIPPPADPLPFRLPADVQSCGKVLTGMNGSFSSPNYPQHYPENATCRWVIQVPKGFTLKITFHSFNFDSFCDDYIAVYGGKPYGCCRPVAFYCSYYNSESTSDLKLSSRNAYIRFKSDGRRGRGTGFRGTFAAQDVDECKLLERGFKYNLCSYNSRCINTFGSYQCECPNGLFSPSVNKNQCLDVNECMDNNHGCSHKCINTYKSYICKCPAGMVLGTDKKTCHNDIDECKENSTNKCEDICNNTDGSYFCTCHEGRVLSYDKYHCQHACGGKVIAPGSIFTPMSETKEGFSTFTECKWFIQAQGSMVVNVNLPEIHQSPSHHRCESYWEFRNGPDASSPFLVKHCSGSPLGVVKSSTPSMYVKWHSGNALGPILTLQFTASSLDLGPKGKSTCGGAVSSVIVTDLTPSGFPAVITTVKRCTWLLLKPANRRELRVSFAYFDVIGNAACSDNRVEVFDGFSRRLASLCTTAASRRSFTLRSSFSHLKLVVTNPRNFHGFHAKLLLV